MYGIITNLDGLTTGDVNNPGWSPENESKPDMNHYFKGKRLWVYGGGCSPEGKTSNIPLQLTLSFS